MMRVGITFFGVGITILVPMLKKGKAAACAFFAEVQKWSQQMLELQQAQLAEVKAQLVKCRR